MEVGCWTWHFYATCLPSKESCFSAGRFTVITLESENDAVSYTVVCSNWQINSMDENNFQLNYVYSFGSNFFIILFS